MDMIPLSTVDVDTHQEWSRNNRGSLIGEGDTDGVRVRDCVGVTEAEQGGRDVVVPNSPSKPLTGV